MGLLATGLVRGHGDGRPTSWRWSPCSRTWSGPPAEAAGSADTPATSGCGCSGRRTHRSPWAWRVNRHHLAVHLTSSGTGWPAPRSSSAPTGGRATRTARGLRTLPLRGGPGPRAARAAGRRAARGGRDRPVAPQDIATRRDPVANPGLVSRGLPPRTWTARSARRSGLVRLYVERVTPALARPRGRRWGRTCSPTYLRVGGRAGVWRWRLLRGARADVPARVRQRPGRREPRPHRLARPARRLGGRPPRRTPRRPRPRHPAR